MNTQNDSTNKNKNKKTKKIIMYIALAVISLGIFLIAGTIHADMSSDVIKDNVYIDNIDVSGLTKEEALDKVILHNQNKYDSIELDLLWNDYKKTVVLDDIEFVYDCEKSVDEALQAGRTGTFLSNIINSLFNKEVIHIATVTSFDAQKLNDIVNTVSSEIDTNFSNNRYAINDNQLLIHIGHTSYTLDKDSLLTELSNRISDMDTTPIELNVEVKSPDEINVEKILQEANIEVENAKFEYNNNEVTIVEGKPGRRLSREKLLQTLDEYKNKKDSNVIIVLEKVEPEVNADYLKENLFADKLSGKTTTFYTNTQNNINRGINIGLSGGAINELVLAPGEEFSFNDVVGERTAKAGYQVAHVYYDGKIVDGIGGGICQVSTTLYNAALYADLEITERRSHMFTVGYIPLGFDASVSYGTVDLKFVNSSEWPIKILCTIQKIDNNSSTIAFEIIGTKTQENKRVELYNKVIEERPFKTKIQYDDSKKEDKITIIQYGKLGYIVESFKKVVVGDEVISHKSLGLSYYIPHDQVEVHGTLPVDPE